MMSSLRVLQNLLARNPNLRSVRMLSSLLRLSDVMDIPKNPITDSWSILTDKLKENNSTIVVLDDDPTGCQTVYDTNVLLDYSVSELRHQLKLDHKMFYILTNTRAKSELDAININKIVLNNLHQAAQDIGYSKDIRFVSRGDSTMRGHYPAELLPFLEQRSYDGILLIPCFFDGGRVTLDDIHYVIDDATQTLVPCGITPFAKDSHFGYRSSNLKDFIEEKSKGLIKAQDVLSISIADIREGGVQHIVNLLHNNVIDGKTVVVNALCQDDLNVVTAACIQAETEGKVFLYRTAASFVASRTSMVPRPLLSGEQILRSRPPSNCGSTRNGSDGVISGGVLSREASSPLSSVKSVPSSSSPSSDSSAMLSRSYINSTPVGGLMVIGSYVPKTTSQLIVLKEKMKIYSFEFHVPSFMLLRKFEKLRASDNKSQKCRNDIPSMTTTGMIKQLSNHINQLLLEGYHVVLFTSREVLTEGLISDYTAISDAITEIVKHLTVQPKFLVSKGGITSHDVALKGLDVKTATVEGQILPGVPVWTCNTGKFPPGMRYIVFPGNVGSENALVECMEKLGVRRQDENIYSLRDGDISSDYVDEDIISIKSYHHHHHQQQQLSEVELKWKQNSKKNDTIKILSNTQNESSLQKRAVAAFNVYNLEGAKAVIEAAEQLDTDVILQVHPSSLQFGGPALLSALRVLKSLSSTSIAIHLDHCNSEADIRLAIAYGVDSIMADGSHLSLEENMQWTASMAHIAHSNDVAIEAELGKLAGEEDGLCVSEKESKMTDPNCVVEFMKRTKVDMLAVTIGNVHGKYHSSNPQLDIARLEVIRTNLQHACRDNSFDAVPYLVLHGASGLARDVINQAICNGISKFNVNTDLRDSAIKAISHNVQFNSKVDVLPLMDASCNAMKKVAVEKMLLFGAKWI